MTGEIIINGPNKDFESTKEVDENGVEFWTARNLFPLLGYATWQAFDDVVVRAAKAALNSGQIVKNHFSQLTKMVDIGSGGKRAIKDWKLDRYACYLIAQNGDPKIPQIAIAQTYFAVQTRRQEVFDKLLKLMKNLRKIIFEVIMKLGELTLWLAERSDKQLKILEVNCRKI